MAKDLRKKDTGKGSARGARAGLARGAAAASADGDGARRRRGRPAAVAGLQKRSEEREHYEARVRENEARLASGLAADGTPLSDTQRSNLAEILGRQRRRLAELSG